VCFDNAELNGNAYFKFSKFNKDTYFRSSRFNKIASFVLTIFHTNADFTGAFFNSEANFYQSNFTNSSSIATFKSVNFNDIANFGSSNFNNMFVTFSDSNFNNNANFFKAKLGNFAYFKNSRFNRKVDFRSSNLCNADFSNSEFKSTADFSDSSLVQVISFNNSYFTDAFFEGANLNCTLYLNRIKYDRFYIRWDAINILAYDDAVYLSLIENFKKLGYFDDAKDCYYKYSILKTAQKSIFSRLIDYIIWASCGYGVKPEYSIYSGCFIFLLFGIVYFCGSNLNGVTLTDSFNFSAIALFSLPKDFYIKGPKEYEDLLGQDTKFEKHNFKLIRILVIIERLIGWSLLLFFINALSRTMIHI
jgi:hypothetical protein